MLHDLLNSLLAGITDPMFAFLDSTRRAYLPFLLGAALLGTLIWFVKLRQRCSLWSFLFPKRIWLHPSAVLDYKLMFVRALLNALLLAPFVISSAKVAHLVSGGLSNALGTGPSASASPAVAMAFFTIAGFLGDDCARYVVHRLAHQVPILWELHKVHHSAEVLTPFSVYRTHPIESVIMRAGAAIGVGVAAGIASFLFHGRISAWDILGVHALSFLWNLFGSNLRHSHVWISYGPILERVFISPAQHQIHHSDDIRHYHRNYGSALAIWDLIGGSLYVTKGREQIRFGLPKHEQNHGNTVLSMLLAPLKAWLALTRTNSALRAATVRERSTRDRS